MTASGTMGNERAAVYWSPTTVAATRVSGNKGSRKAEEFSQEATGVAPMVSGSKEESKVRQLLWMPQAVESKEISRTAT